MRQMTLDDVVKAGQDGREWQQQQEQVARQRKAQEDLDAAEQAAAGILTKSQSEWAASGSPGQYRPSDTTMLSAAEARGMELARRGRWDAFLKNEASVQGHRVRVRSSALQAFEQDGDVDRLARTVYPTIFDGKTIVGSEVVKGGDGGLKGAPSGPTMYRFKLSDGTTKMVEPTKLVADVRKSMIDPIKAAEAEVQLNMMRAKEAIETDGKVKVEKEKGAQERATEGVRTQGRLTLADTETEGRLTVAAAENKGRLQVAGVQAGASRYSADRQLESAKLRADGADGKGLGAAEKWQAMAAKHFGEFKDGGLGGSRIASQATLDLATAAQRIHEANKGVLTESQSLDQAAKFLKLTSPENGLAGALKK